MMHERWKIDRHIPVAVLLALVTQTAAVVGWAAALETRVGVLERTTQQGVVLLERMSRMEERVEGLKDQAVRIEAKLDRVMRR
jgi:hypothetical protein